MPRYSKNSLRSLIAEQYLTGEGIEIGALHSPLEVPIGVKVRYVDRMPVNQLKQTYPELSEYNLVEVDVVDNGETLTSVSDASVDFVIANHMVEHCQNPVFSIENWLRVLKPHGILYMAVPDKRYTFDCDRRLTSLEHMIRDYTEGPLWSKNSHFEEWARFVDKLSENEVSGRAQYLTEIDYSIHFHVWTQAEFLELLLYCQRHLCFPVEIELLQKNSVDEFIVVLSKTAERLELGVQMQQTQAEVDRLNHQLHSTQAELQRSETMINAMQTSKFWKLRTAWFGFQKMIGLNRE